MRAFARPSPGTAPAATPELTVVAATRLEAWAARRNLSHVIPVVRCGIGARTPTIADGSTAVVCGLAGSLAEDLRVGTVVVPASVSREDGSSVECDKGLQDRFLWAARELGFEASGAPMITLDSMLTGASREAWRRRGYVAVDMESAWLLPSRGRLAVVRVILDSPSRELAEEWLSPLSIAMRPRLWPQAAWLAIDGPRYALRAGRVVARGLQAGTP